MAQPRVATATLVAVLAATAAGCLAAPVADDARDAAPGALSVLRATLVTLEGFAGEPSVAVGPAGTIYVTGPGGTVTPESSRLWVSHDDGVTFEFIAWADPGTGVANLPFGLEGDVAVDRAGTAYFVDLSNANTQLSSSTDDGRSWLVQTPAVFAVSGGDRPWVAAGDPGVVAVAWNQAATGYWIAVSTDGGRTFPTQTNLDGSGAVDGGGSFAGVPAFAPDGTIYAARLVDPVVTDDEDAWGPTVYRSTDGGATLTRHVAHSTANRTGWMFVVPAVDAAGNVYVAWAETDGDRTIGYYAASTDRGDTWNAPVAVSHHNGSTAMPWLAASEAGHVAVAFYGAPDALDDPDTVPADAQWFPFVTDVRAAHTATPEQRTARLTDEPVLEGPMCMLGLSCNSGDAQGSRRLGDYLMVDIGPDERVHTVWTANEQVVWWAVTAV